MRRLRPDARCDFEVDVPLALGGDDDARNRVWTSAYAYVLAVGNRRGADYDDAATRAADVTAWIFTQGGLAQFRRARGSFQAWLVALSQNLPRDRRKSIETVGGEFAEIEFANTPDDAPTPEDDLLARERQDIYGAVIESLRPRERDVFDLVAQLVPLKEIAVRVGLSPSRVRQIVHSIKARMRAAATGAGHG